MSILHEVLSWATWPWRSISIRTVTSSSKQGVVQLLILINLGLLWACRQRGEAEATAPRRGCCYVLNCFDVVFTQPRCSFPSPVWQFLTMVRPFGGRIFRGTPLRGQLGQTIKSSSLCFQVPIDVFWTPHNSPFLSWHTDYRVYLECGLLRQGAEFEHSGVPEKLSLSDDHS